MQGKRKFVNATRAPNDPLNTAWLICVLLSPCDIEKTSHFQARLNCGRLTVMQLDGYLTGLASSAIEAGCCQPLYGSPEPTGFHLGENLSATEMWQSLMLNKQHCQVIAELEG